MSYYYHSQQAREHKQLREAEEKYKSAKTEKEREEAKRSVPPRLRGRLGQMVRPPKTFGAPSTYKLVQNPRTGKWQKVARGWETKPTGRVIIGASSKIRPIGKAPGVYDVGGRKLASITPDMKAGDLLRISRSTGVSPKLLAKTVQQSQIIRDERKMTLKEAQQKTPLMLTPDLRKEEPEPTKFLTAFDLQNRSVNLRQTQSDLETREQNISRWQEQQHAEAETRKESLDLSSVFDVQQYNAYVSQLQEQETEKLRQFEVDRQNYLSTADLFNKDIIRWNQDVYSMDTKGAVEDSSVLASGGASALLGEQTKESGAKKVFRGLAEIPISIGKGIGKFLYAPNWLKDTKPAIEIGQSKIFKTDSVITDPDVLTAGAAAGFALSYGLLPRLTKLAVSGLVGYEGVKFSKDPTYEGAGRLIFLAGAPLLGKFGEFGKRIKAVELKEAVKTEAGKLKAQIGKIQEPTPEGIPRTDVYPAKYGKLTPYEQQLLLEVQTGQRSLTDVPAKIGTAFRKDILGKSSIQPLKRPPSVFEKELQPYAKPEQVRVLELKEAQAEARATAIRDVIEGRTQITPKSPAWLRSGYIKAITSRVYPKFEKAPSIFEDPAGFQKFTLKELAEAKVILPKPKPIKPFEPSKPIIKKVVSRPEIKPSGRQQVILEEPKPVTQKQLLRQRQKVDLRTDQLQSAQLKYLQLQKTKPKSITIGAVLQKQKPDIAPKLRIVQIQKAKQDVTPIVDTLSGVRPAQRQRFKQVQALDTIYPTYYDGVEYIPRQYVDPVLGVPMLLTPKDKLLQLLKMGRLPKGYDKYNAQQKIKGWTVENRIRDLWSENFGRPDITPPKFTEPVVSRRKMSVEELMKYPLPKEKKSNFRKTIYKTRPSSSFPYPNSPIFRYGGLAPQQTVISFPKECITRSFWGRATDNSERFLSKTKPMSKSLASQTSFSKKSFLKKLKGKVK